METAYKVKLEVFEGPFDLLLYLIKRDELDIYDIPIARITDSYVHYVSMLKEAGGPAGFDINLAGAKPILDRNFFVGVSCSGRITR